MTRLLDQVLAGLAEDLALAAAESAMVRVDGLHAALPVEARLARDPAGELPVAVRADLPGVTWRGALEPELGRLSVAFARTALEEDDA